tara:strand:- start:397 stop:2082 length:1686 start_codon:yes stop_codon:yes gene_type:complete
MTQISSTTFKSNTTTLYADNTTGNIGADDLRTQMDNTADSVVFKATGFTAPPTASDDAADTATNGVFLVGDVWVDETNNKSYMSVDSTAGAASWIEITEVTNVTNVTAAGALMDSEVTNLAQVKAFDTTDYATAAQGTLADAALPRTGGTMTGSIAYGTNRARFGANEFDIYVAGTIALLTAEIGDIWIRNTSTDGVVQLQADNGSGGNANYVTCDGAVGEVQLKHYGIEKLATKAGGVDVTGDLSLPDSGVVNLGTGDDLQLYHNGSDSFIDNNVGRLIIRNYTNNEGILLQADDGAGGLASYVFADGATGEVSIRHYGAIKLTTKAGGVDVTGNLSLTNGGELQLGTNNDFLAYHNGSNAFIENDTGEMFIRQLTTDGRMLFQADNGSGATHNYIILDGATGEVELRYGNAIKLATKTGGVDVTGTLTATNFAGACLLGTVSQSGGVPTGSIIEQGSNANGVYVRFADGTQICTNQAFTTSATVDSTWTYPAAFVYPASPDRPVVTGSISSVFGSASFLHIGGISGTGGFATSITVNAVKYDGSRQSLSAGLLAVGRWF